MVHLPDQAQFVQLPPKGDPRLCRSSARPRQKQAAFHACGSSGREPACEHEGGQHAQKILVGEVEMAVNPVHARQRRAPGNPGV